MRNINRPYKQQDTDLQWNGRISGKHSNLRRPSAQSREQTTRMDGEHLGRIRGKVSAGDDHEQGSKEIRNCTRLIAGVTVSMRVPGWFQAYLWCYRISKLSLVWPMAIAYVLCMYSVRLITTTVHRPRHGRRMNPDCTRPPSSRPSRPPTS